MPKRLNIVSSGFELIMLLVALVALIVAGSIVAFLLYGFGLYTGIFRVWAWGF